MFEHSLKNAYIGYAREPWADTVAYYPFKTNRNDYSGNGYNVTNTYSTTIADFNWVSCLNFNGSMCQVWTIDTLTSYSNYTIIARFYCINSTATCIFFKEWGSWGGSGFSTWDASWNQIRWGNTTNTYSQISSPISWTWVLCGVTALNWVWSFYINWVQTIYKSSWVIAPNHNTTPLSIGGTEAGTASSSGYLSELIIEKKWWTDQEVLNYYNKTKANYWL